MSTVTISKTQYEALKRRATAYDRLITAARKDVFSPPPTRDRKEVMREFRATKKYSTAFLESLDKGLARSSYFKSR
jgi:hypothetical protein